MELWFQVPIRMSHSKAEKQTKTAMRRCGKTLVFAQLNIHENIESARRSWAMNDALQSKREQQPALSAQLIHRPFKHVNAHLFTVLFSCFPLCKAAFVCNTRGNLCFDCIQTRTDLPESLYLMAFNLQELLHYIVSSTTPFCQKS